MKGISDIIVVLFLSIGLTIVALLGFYLASYHYTIYRETIAMQEGRKLISDIYNLACERVGAGYAIKVPVRLTEGFLKYRAEHVYLTLTISTGTESYTLGSDVLEASSPIIYYEYGGEETVNLEHAVSFAAKGVLGLVSSDPFLTVNLFKYAENRRFVTGLAWLPAYHTRVEKLGSSRRLVVLVLVPLVENRQAFTAPVVLCSRGGIQIAVSQEVAVFRYTFNTPTTITLTFTAYSDSVPSTTITRSFANISEVVVRVIKYKFTITSVSF